MVEKELLQKNGGENGGKFLEWDFEKKKKKQGKRMSEAEGKQLVVKMSDTLQGQGQIIWRNYFLINN